MASRTPASPEKPDAGLRNKNKLPQWRYIPRQKLIHLVRWETPYLAYLQDRIRSPALDSYFAITANLGTHTFFMVVLPILFWCGYTSLGRGLVHILASGVFFSGFVKDLLCLPRPLSPPLQRITMSGSAALEYGFPSTHSTNAVSVAVYALFALHDSDENANQYLGLFLKTLSYCYAISIVLGRLYCGMHGFLDVIIGSALGALLSVVQCLYGEMFDDYLYSGSLKAPFIVVLIILVLVRIHPEPADDCPCFDDSVAFAGVMIGVELGNVHYAQSGLAWDYPVPSTAPFELEALGWPKTIARIMLGVLVIFAWRGVMKPTLLRLLPPIFRIVERLGLSLPRKFFKQASEYKKVPKHLKDDNVIPSVSEIPSFLTSMRHPRRSRGVSVGPQSAADAYEALAYREKRRRESITSLGATSPSIKESNGSAGYIDYAKPNNQPLKVQTSGLLPTPNSSDLALYEQMMGSGTAVYTPPTPISDAAYPYNSISRSASEDRRQNEEEERQIFSKLEKPRVRYDVEVITKLIVYTGIAWWAVEGNPVLFELVGLGFSKQTG
ncbi:MAG: sphingosine-1-phosphate phosphohydrolase [Lasallia pustulata]|uniref:Sphingosine-1-phosphate phosphohydrolase n=1 Tax=Lasallia pustulata TaxID=136370 RepID=A0A5M8PFD4_9LECA|nr:MAG: sphingosine-1-phosphate phosphohydrolase [Lasallia pustulata]